MTVTLGACDVIIALTAAGRPQAEVALAAGISVRTLRRRLTEPEIVGAVATARLDLERQAVGRLQVLRERAFIELEALLTTDDLRVVLSACRLILDQGLAYRAAMPDDHTIALEARLAALVAQTRTGNR